MNDIRNMAVVKILAKLSIASRPRLLFILLFIFVRLLFEGGYYSRVACTFLGKPADINDSLISYIIMSEAVTTARRCQKYSKLLSPAVSHGNDSYNTNSPSAT